MSTEQFNFADPKLCEKLGKTYTKSIIINKEMTKTGTNKSNETIMFNDNIVNSYLELIKVMLELLIKSKLGLRMREDRDSNFFKKVVFPADIFFSEVWQLINPKLVTSYPLLLSSLSSQSSSLSLSSSLSSGYY
jgi:hypothetical protein